MDSPAAGLLLIADPFLKDPNFMRTVVLLCDHHEEGTMGFVINKQIEQMLDELMEGFDGTQIPVYYGGPVQTDTLHFLHQYPDKILGGQEVMKDVFWGGDFEVLSQMIKNGEMDFNKIRFFLGYSGWGTGQLTEELDQKSWLTVTAVPEILFHENPDDIWKDSLKLMGKEYEVMINYPIDPSLN